MAAVATAALLLVVAFLGALARAQGDDFDLSDALDDRRKPTEAPRQSPGGAGDDFDLSDALGGRDPDPPPPPRPRDPKKPDARPSGGADFSNTDLEDAAAGGRGGRRGPQGGADGDSNPDTEGTQPQGLIPGVVAAVVAAVGGAVSGFVAYQRRRLCFREDEPARSHPPDDPVTPGDPHGDP
ncbi:hypothetical protein STEG23_037294 [Scotinomys teguina]